jgi:hypothetical protein
MPVGEDPGIDASITTCALVEMPKVVKEGSKYERDIVLVGEAPPHARYS